MELSRTEYPSMLTSLQPTPAVNVLRERLRKVSALNTEIADWLQERRKVEESYAQGLMKLAKRSIPGEQLELGIFQTPWSRIINSTSQLANSHQLLAQKIETEVERPLREFTQANKEWAGLKACEGNLSTVAKQIDTAEDKADKLKRRGARAQAAKVAEAAAAVEKASVEWESQAPFVFEKLQAVDETRCNNLRDSLTRYHTLEVDQAQRAMQLAEESLSTLLDLHANDEIRTFAETVTNGKQKLERIGSRAPSTAASAAAGMPSSTPTPSVVTDDSVSVQSAGSGSGGGSGGGLGHGLGLRRLGTVLRGRTRNNNTPYVRPSSPPRSSERLPSSKKEGQHPITPASPRMSEFASTSSRNLSVPTPGSSSSHDSARPSTPKANVTEESQKDSEGYTIPPPVTDIGGVPLEELTEQTQPHIKVEIKDDIIPEEEEDADAAISKVTSHLRMNNNTVIRKNLRGRRDRDARDVRNTVFFPAGTGPPDPLELLNNSSPPLTPLKAPRAAPTIASEASDTQSIRSSRSVTSLGGIVKHPELHQPGLSSSIVETVNARFEGGAPVRVTVVGEVALAYNPRENDLMALPTTETVRMDNFFVLDKVAPNPNFIHAIPERPGEYALSLANLNKTTVGFKYQVHLEESTWMDYLPVIVTPAWRIEPHQASVILNYKPNPNYHRLGGSTTPITLKNVVFVTGIEGTTPTSCQSKPVGAFSREMGRIAWKLGELTLDDTSAAGKLVARFSLENGAGTGVKQLPSEMRWEIVGDDAKTAGSVLSVSSLVKEVEVKEEVDPFADDEVVVKESEAGEKKEGVWKPLFTVRKLAGGKYLAA
ncbi:Muniscin C-terminal mu homology domain-containing protein [Kalaharituber pfeilii]|nr:Muniscin C-terminal mu homology domain-containing protein [Kalaharituber pfeilii]